MTRVFPPMARFDPLLALLLLLPAAWLAVPSTLALQLEPEISATGWWVLLQIPPALLLFARASRPSLPLVKCFGAFVACSWLTWQFNAPSDTLSASRAVMGAIASLSALCAGCALGPSGRRVFAGGLVLISIGLCVPALAGISPRLQGALQNSGATSEAALLGALGALAAFAGARGWLRLVAGAAIGAYGLFVVLAPALAGAASFLVVALLATILRRADRRQIAGGLGLFVLATALAYASTRAKSLEPSEQRAGSQEHSAGHLGGVGVRLSIAPRALALFGDHPWLGVGPGQFRATFPPYRDASERAKSNRAAGSGVETEVEHAHDDVLTTLVESGVLGGLPWIAVQVWLGICALRALSKRDSVRAVLALAVLGVLVNAWLRSPLNFNPASASLFFAAAGALIANDEASVSPRGTRRWFPLLCVVLLVHQIPRALSFLQHGLAMRASESLDAPTALAACPDSALALSLIARQFAADPARTQEARSAWERVLRLRPFHFEALVQLGVLEAQAGDDAMARAHWSRALELAPERAGILKNLLLLEARSGDDESFAKLAARALGTVERAWAIEAGVKELLAGEERAALRLWKFARCDWIEETPQQLYDRARAGYPEPSLQDKAWEMLANLRWAREHAATNNYSAAVRSYRQALRNTSQARAMHLELAAALWSDGKPEAARAEIERAQPRAVDWAKLAPWARETLSKAGLFVDQ